MSLLDHFNIFDVLISEMLAAGAKIEEMDKVSYLLLTLPSSYNGVITAIETLSEENLTLAFVKNRLLDHEIKIKNDNSDTSRKVMKAFAQNNSNQNNKFQNFRNRPFKHKQPFKGKSKINVNCHHCGKEGHIKKDCFYYKRTKKNNKEKGEKQAHTATTTQHGFAFMLNAGNTKYSMTDKVGFILDSGATDHLINDESLFADSEQLEHPLKIAVAKQGEFIYATKRGIVRLHNGHPITLEDVLYSKEAAGNLISVKRLQEAGMSIEFDKNGVTISKDGLIVVKNSGMLNNVPIIKFQAYTAKANIKNNYRLWHERFGHISNSKLLEIKRKNLFSDSSLLNNLEFSDEICEPCLNGKQARLPFKQYKDKSYIKDHFL